MRNKLKAVPTSERDWEAESDCDTLMRAEKIKRDKNRYGRAQKVAKQRLEEAAMLIGESKE